MRGRDAAFVVRIWVEEREIDGAPPVWRGLVEESETGARSYLTDLDGISGFVEPYLQGLLGAAVPLPADAAGAAGGPVDQEAAVLGPLEAVATTRLMRRASRRRTYTCL